MKKPVFGPILALLLLSLLSTILANASTNVTVVEAKAMMDSNPSLVILDVRTQSEYNSVKSRKRLPIVEYDFTLPVL